MAKLIHCELQTPACKAVNEFRAPLGAPAWYPTTPTHAQRGRPNLWQWPPELGDGVLFPTDLGLCTLRVEDSPTMRTQPLAVDSIGSRVAICELEDCTGFRSAPRVASELMA